MKPAVCATFLGLLCAIASPAAYARLTIYGPQTTILEGEDVTLECLSDGDSDMANYTFEKYSKWMRTWVRLDVSCYMRSWYFGVNISRSDERLLMHLGGINQKQNGRYRCVKTDNRTSEDGVSEEFAINVIYLQNLLLHSWYSSESDTWSVKKGSTVEVKCTASASQEPIYEWSQEFSDWILPSDTLVLKNVNEDSEGKYICQARLPDMWSLVKTRSFQLRVMENQEEVRAVWSSLSFGDILIYLTIPGVLLPFLVFTLFIVIRYRSKQMKKPQISLVDGEKRAPIYKGSLQSVCSANSDTQPLVM